jgi:hypothetical protein
MGMRINTARHDILAAGVDGLRALRRIETLSYGLDFPAATQHIGAERPVGCNHCAAFD